MPAPRCRLFGLLDAMVLTAATAVGLWIGLSTREIIWNGFGEVIVGWPEVSWPDTSDGLLSGKTCQEVHRFVTSMVYQGLPLVFTWTLAVFGLRLRQPHPPLRRLVHQPGFAACAAVSIVASVNLLGHLSASLGDVSLNLSLTWYRDWNLTEIYPASGFAHAVAAIWGVMILGRSAPSSSPAGSTAWGGYLESTGLSP